MKRKSYIMPIVLLIFVFLIVAFFSIYHRTISTHNTKNSKELSLENKIENISFYEVLSTKSTIDYVNTKLNERKNFKIELNISGLLSINGITNYPKYFDKYKLSLNSKKLKRKLNFYDKTNKKSYFINKYEIFFELRNKNEIIEYRIVDKNRIENYLFDLQIKNLIDRKVKILSDYFYFDLNEDFTKLYERIFSNEIQETYFGNYRIYDYNKKIYLIDNDVYKNLNEIYFFNKDIDINGLDIDLYNINEFIEKNDLKNVSKSELIENFLIKNSVCLKDFTDIFVNIDIDNKLYFDFTNENDIYANFKINNDNSRIIVLNKSPKIKGVFVNNSNIENFDFDIDGLIFSKNKLKSNYKFLPEILDITSRFVKISDDFYLEKIDIHDIK